MVYLFCPLQLRLVLCAAFGSRIGSKTHQVVVAHRLYDPSIRRTSSCRLRVLGACQIRTTGQLRGQVVRMKEEIKIKQYSMS